MGKIKIAERVLANISHFDNDPPKEVNVSRRQCRANMDNITWQMATKIIVRRAFFILEFTMRELILTKTMKVTTTIFSQKNSSGLPMLTCPCTEGTNSFYKCLEESVWIRLANNRVSSFNKMCRHDPICSSSLEICISIEG